MGPRDKREDDSWEAGGPGRVRDDLPLPPQQSAATIWAPLARGNALDERRGAWFLLMIISYALVAALHGIERES